MGTLAELITETLLPGMHLPQPLLQLFNWMQNNGLVDCYNGRWIGSLHEDKERCAKQTDNDRPGGTIIEFAAEGNVNVKYWFRSEDPEIINRLCVFARTGKDGSMAAFWLDDDGKQVIVHLGSGSGSTLCCVLAENPIDFLRLLAIGYDEICWNENFAQPPNTDTDFVVHPNPKYQEWVRDTFSVTIPQTALEIVQHPCEMCDPNAEDRFTQWLNRVQN